jgi:predicted nucleotidyltransferase
MKSRETVSKLVKMLVSRYSPKKIILFGSYAWSKPTKHSDIDLFIVKNTRKKPNERFSEVQKILYGMHESIPVEPLVLTPKELERRIAIQDPFVLRILKKGKMLYGQ